MKNTLSVVFGIIVYLTSVYAHAAGIDEVIHGYRDGKIVLDNRPVVYVVIDPNDEYAEKIKTVIQDIYSKKSFKTIYFRTEIELQEVKAIHPTSIWLSGRFAGSLMQVGEPFVAAYVILPSNQPPTTNIQYPIGILLKDSLSESKAWAEWSRQSQGRVVVNYKDIHSLKEYVADLVQRTETLAIRMHR